MNSLRQQRDLVQDLGGAAKSIANSASTIVSDILSQARSAAVAAATSVPEAAGRVDGALGALAASVREIEERLPKSCSIGTQRACIGYTDNTTCFQLPLNLSSLIMEVSAPSSGPVARTVQRLLIDRVEQLQPLADRLSDVTSYFQRILFAGLILSAISTIVFVCVCRHDWWQAKGSTLHSWGRMGMLIALGIVCCAPFTALVALFLLLRARQDTLPSWVEAASGQVSSLCLGALACVLLMVTLTAVAACRLASSPKKTGTVP